MSEEAKGREFEVRGEIELPASPEQVWAAIATGPGVDSWFIGHMDIEPREGGQASMAVMPGVTQQFTVTGWEPGRRFALQGDPGMDDAFEYLIEGRGQSTTVLRFVHSGFMSGDWDSEYYDALSAGDRMYLAKLASYLRYFPGQTAAFHVMSWGPQVTDTKRVWSAFTTAAGLTARPDAAPDPTAIREGDRGLVTIGRDDPAEAVVDYLTPSFLGLRTSDSFYGFIHGYRDVVVVEQHAFAGDEQARKLAEGAWGDWVSESFT